MLPSSAATGPTLPRRGVRGQRRALRLYEPSGHPARALARGTPAHPHLERLVVQAQRPGDRIDAVLSRECDRRPQRGGHRGAPLANPASLLDAAPYRLDACRPRGVPPSHEPSSLPSDRSSYPAFVSVRTRPNTVNAIEFTSKARTSLLEHLRRATASQRSSNHDRKVVRGVSRWLLPTGLPCCREATASRTPCPFQPHQKGPSAPPTSEETPRSGFRARSRPRWGHGRRSRQ